MIQSTSLKWKFCLSFPYVYCTEFPSKLTIVNSSLGITMGLYPPMFYVQHTNLSRGFSTIPVEALGWAERNGSEHEHNIPIM